MAFWHHRLRIALMLSWLILMAFPVKAEIGSRKEQETTSVIPVEAPDEPTPPAQIPTLDSREDSFTVFPVGLDIGQSPPTITLVKGQEESGQPDAFDQWLLPFDDVMRALNVQVTTLDSGDWELRSPISVTRLHPNDLTHDPDLGIVFSIAEIRQYFNIPISFDIADYTIQFELPTQPSQQWQTDAKPILTDGLPTLTSNSFSLSGIGQQTILSGGHGDRSNSTDVRGRFNAVGTAFGGAWYLDVEQPDLQNSSSWYLDELQYLNYDHHSDYVLGSQTPFWQSQSNDYWGATWIQRWGVEPPSRRSREGFNPRQRLQANNVGRTVSGETTPGTLVQLTRNNQIIDEDLVDSSGLYRFTDVSTEGVGRYRVLLFPDGQLTATPEEYDATFSNLPGQLPDGASALVLSAGVNRERNHQSFGNFSDFRGGIGYRAGVSESLTLGAGIVQENSPTLISEAFYSPSQSLKAAVSALFNSHDGDVDVNADVGWQPTKDLTVNVMSDRFAQALRANWQVFPNVALTASGNTRDDAMALGTRVNLNRGDFYLLGQATMDTNRNVRWHVNARYGAFGLRHRGDEIITQSQLSYNLSGKTASGDGHRLTMGYETRHLNDFRQLATASWRYRSSDRNVDGRALWDIELGYGVGIAGSGPIAAVTTGILPGLDLQARYQGVTALSNQSTFRLELSPRLNLQQGLNFGNHRQDWLRTQGGLMIQPFLDHNSNGQQDPDEPAYLDNLDLLITINHEALDRYQPHRQRNYATVALSPGLYRIDVDPAGFPLDYQATERALAVDIAPGEYTQLAIPLGRSFSVSGVVLDADGNAMAGQQVSAVHTTADQRQLSVTNGAGVFYLEGLTLGEYRFEVNTQAGANTVLSFDRQTHPFQEINFQVLPHTIEMSPNP